MNNFEYIPEDEVEGFEDINLVAVLTYCGIKISHFDRNTHKHGQVTFYFNKSEELDELVKKYWTENISVEPKRFTYIIRDLKSRINNASLQT